MKEFSRRGFFQGMGAGAAAAAIMTPQDANASDFFAGLVGQRFAGSEVESAEEHLGAFAVLLRDAEGARFQVDVLRVSDSGPNGLIDAAGLRFFLCNRGNGRSPSHESHGQAAMAFARWCEERAGTPSLMSWSERAAAHPRGAFYIA